MHILPKKSAGFKVWICLNCHVINHLASCTFLGKSAYCLHSVNIRQACISADSSFAEAEQRLKALKELCDTLSPEDAHRLAQTQLKECENRLAAIQRQFSGDQDAPLPDSR